MNIYLLHLLSIHHNDKFTAKNPAFYIGSDEDSFRETAKDWFGDRVFYSGKATMHIADAELTVEGIEGVIVGKSNIEGFRMNFSSGYCFCCHFFDCSCDNDAEFEDQSKEEISILIFFDLSFILLR